MLPVFSLTLYAQSHYGNLVFKGLGVEGLTCVEVILGEKR